MATFSIKDVLLGLKNECEILQENWQGEKADVYLCKVMNSYLNYANAIEKVLQEINEELDKARNELENESDSIYEHAPKKR